MSFSLRTATTTASLTLAHHVGISSGSSSSSSCISNHSRTTLLTRYFSTQGTQVTYQAPRPIATKPASAANETAPKDQLSQVRRYPNHPLNQFFRIQAKPLPKGEQPPTNAIIIDTMSEGESKKIIKVPFPQSLLPSDLAKDSSSRAWLAPELRLKSSKDLHTLWYVLLIERNRLATSWEEVGRIGARQSALMFSQSLASKTHRLRKSMARIKYVLNERRLALIDAQKQVRQSVTDTPTSSSKKGPVEKQV